MRSVTADDATKDFGAVLDAAEHGETVNVIKDGETVARVEPGDRRRVVDRIVEVFEKYPVDPEWADDLERTVRELRAFTTDQERKWPVD
jgi:antitoxin (DNA-binding transcriptional repressor) of toxin-antitoxin stability system